MTILLDTDALLWLLGGSNRLGPAARGVLDDPDETVWTSTASLWEVAVKHRAGRLHVDVATVRRGAELAGLLPLTITAEHSAGVERLPVVAGHRDPFDQLLIAQAIAEGCAFMTSGSWAANDPARVLPADR